jgi:hypothetical protein
MGLSVDSLYVDNFNMSLSNVYVAVAQRDIIIKTSKISPYKGTWINYSYGVWPSEEMRRTQIFPVTTVDDKVEYDPGVALYDQIYTHIKTKLTNYKNVL